MKKFTFPLDRSKFTSKPLMFQYIEDKYPELLSDEMSPSRLYFNLKYNKTHGTCVMSGKPTQWNEITQRYERFAGEKERLAYREMFKRRMIGKYGKEHILDEPEQQKKMLDNRGISQEYTFSNGSIWKVNSQYEINFLSFVDSSYCFTADCFSEPPTIYYKIDKDVHFYLPDFYIPSLNLIIEVKGSNPHYQQRDAFKEKLKAEATKKEGFDFLQVNDNIFMKFNGYFKTNVLEN